MSEDFPERTFISEAERKRLRREKETPEERAILQENQRERQRSLRQAQSDQERGKFCEYLLTSFTIDMYISNQK